MRVLIPSALRSYTGQRAEVEADGTTVASVLADLERRFPGIRFRMIDEQDRVRPHMRIFVNRRQVWDLGAVLGPADELHIVLALSGG